MAGQRKNKTGQFRRIGEAVFPMNERLMCDVFEWIPNRALQRPKFTLRFLSPRESKPRKYFVEPVLSHWLKQNASDPKQETRCTSYLTHACAYGLKFLQEFETHSAGEASLYRVCQALFRNRDQGHSTIRRQFNYAADFVNYAEAGASLITPGLDTTAGINSGHLTAYQLANQTLQAAFAECACEANQPQVRSADVIRFYQSGQELPHASLDLASSEEPHLFPLHLWPGRSTLDQFFTEGLVRTKRFDWGTTMSQVSSALIFEHVPAGEFQQVCQRTPLSTAFLGSLAKAVVRKTPKEFDRWFANARSHGFLPLVTKVKDAPFEREELTNAVGAIYRALLWIAYERMARCYGALMFHVYLDFCLHNSEAKPSEEEMWLFRQQHFLLLYLAGLPLAFLGRGQLRWIHGTLRHLWDTQALDGAHYDVCAQLLGVYGSLVQERRQADVAVKRRGKRNVHSEYLESRATSQTTTAETQPNNDTAIGGLEDGPIPLSSTNCPICECKLQEAKLLETVGHNDVRVQLYCSGCEKHRIYQINLQQLRSGLA